MQTREERRETIWLRCRTCPAACRVDSDTTSATCGRCLMRKVASNAEPKKAA